MISPARVGFGLFALALVLASLPAAAQTLGGAQSFDFPLVRLLLGLLVCALVALFAALALRRFMRGGSPRGAATSFRGLLGAGARKIHVVESHRLSTSADVCLFTCGDRQYLVVISASGATLLREEKLTSSQADAVAP